MRKLAEYGVLAMVTFAFTIWGYRMGIEQGADVAICLITTFQNQTFHDGIYMKAEECQAAKKGENNILWLFRKRHEIPQDMLDHSVEVR